MRGTCSPAEWSTSNRSLRSTTQAVETVSITTPTLLDLSYESLIKESSSSASTETRLFKTNNGPALCSCLSGCSCALTTNGSN
jgi:hypothetical protein